MRIESLLLAAKYTADRQIRQSCFALKPVPGGLEPGEVAGGPWRVERVGPSLTRSCRGAPHWWEQVPPGVSPGLGQGAARSL